MSRLKNKNGFSYVLTCVVIICIALFIFSVMQYGYIYHVVREQQESVQLKLDSCVTRYAVERYDALKQGTAYDQYIDRENLVNEAYTVLGFLHSDTEKSEEQYVMYRPQIEPLSDDAFGIRVVYEIVIPFELFHRRIADISVPVTVISQFRQK